MSTLYPAATYQHQYNSSKCNSSQWANAITPAADVQVLVELHALKVAVVTLAAQQ
jgi:hypothetical protein